MQVAKKYTLREKIKFYWQLIKPFKHLTMIVPFVLGTSIALWELGYLKKQLFFLSFLILFFGVASVYIQNEIADYETDKRNASETTGGTKLLVSGKVSMFEAIILMIIFGVISLALGLFLVIKYQYPIWFFILCLIFFIIAYGYSGWPFMFSYRGLGEITLTITNAFAPTFVFYYIQTKHFSILPFLVALPYAIAVFAQKVLREFPDYEPDKLAGKENLVVKFGREKMSKVYRFCLILFIVSIILVDLILIIIYKLNPILFILTLYPIYIAYKFLKITNIEKSFYKNYKILKPLTIKGFKLMFDTALIYSLIFVLDRVLFK